MARLAVGFGVGCRRLVCGVLGLAAVGSQDPARHGTVQPSRCAKTVHLVCGQSFWGRRSNATSTGPKQCAIQTLGRDRLRHWPRQRIDRSGRPAPKGLSRGARRQRRPETGVFDPQTSPPRVIWPSAGAGFARKRHPLSQQESLLLLRVTTYQNNLPKLKTTSKID